MNEQNTGNRRHLLTRAEIEQCAGVDKIHFLNLDARRRNKSLGDLAGLKNLGVHLIEVEPGFASTELHRHYFEDERVYILEGEATVTLDGESFAVGAGDFIAYPASGAAHTMLNTGSATLRCLVVGQRLAHDVVDYPAQNKRLYSNAGERNLVDLAAITRPNAGKKM